MDVAGRMSELLSVPDWEHGEESTTLVSLISVVEQKKSEECSTVAQR